MEIFASHYVVDFDPFAIRFPDGFFLAGVRWYGLAYLAGFIIALLLFNLYSSKGRSPLSKDDNSTLITYLLFGVILGGRLGYMLFYDFPNFIANPLTAFQIWKGGMASHGGFIGVLVAMIFFARSKKVGFWTVSDIVVISATPGIFLGRLANFVNGELWGKVSDVYWAMIFPHSAPVGTPIEQIAARHPSQLYEAFAEGLFIFAVLQYQFWKRKPASGIISGEFLAIYGIVRIFCEMFREPDVGISLIMGMSRGTFYSIFAIAAGLAIMFLCWKPWKRSHGK
ncbi:prolipoprotein diacylglyceryl transferase [Coraliomargarita sp. CAG:312]|nr:prolipoprotein diacylglyceryl transferase [Coraliomargarita sp. CAG:312]